MKTATEKFDIIVLGAGSGGLNIAGFMNRAGFRVLLIDKSDRNIGGDCLNFGCVPSKALIHVAQIVRNAQESEAFGLRPDGKIDLRKVLTYVKERQEVFRTHENAAYFRSLGMTVILGEARFTGPETVTVNGNSYQAKKIVLATGSRPRELDLSGSESIPVYTNESVFDLKALPEYFVFIGGGPISIELGQAFAALGSKVTIVHSGLRILEKEVPEVSQLLEARLRKEGIEIILNARSTSVQSHQLSLSLANEKEQRIPCDALFAGIGRVLNIENLGLEKAGIALTADGRKLIIDEYLRTTNKRVLAVGDVAGQHMFTHAAEVHAGLVIANFFSPFKKRLHPENMAWVTYTSPEVATFGRSAEFLQKNKIHHESILVDLAEDDRGIIENSEGFLKLLVGKGEKILGGTLVAPHAGEIVGELILAEAQKLTLPDLFARIAPYPTASRVIRRAAGVGLSKKLTPLVKQIFRFLYSL